MEPLAVAVGGVDVGSVAGEVGVTVAGEDEGGLGVGGGGGGGNWCGEW